MRQVQPPLLRYAGVHGTVVVEFVVGADGKPEMVTMEIARSDNETFNEPARQVVERMLFSPGQIRGTPVRVLVEMPINF